MPILTAKQGTNADLFPDVLALYAKPDDRILDMTFGRGVFWRNVNGLKANLVTNDLVAPADHAYDCRSTAFKEESFDVVVFDPPYMHTSGSVKESIAKCYNTNTSAVFKNQKDVDAFFVAGIAEARRLLKPKGVLFVKCQDTIESARPHWTHVKIMQSEGFRCEDLFVLVQATTPAMSSRWSKQYHARKNHSYFVVLRKTQMKVNQPDRESGNVMNFKLVLKTYSQLRQLTDDESALLETLRGMSDAERELLAEALGPPVKAKMSKAAVKRNIDKCVHFVDGGTCGLTRRAMIHQVPTTAGFHEFEQSPSSAKKSARASSLASAISGTAGHGISAAQPVTEPAARCTYQIGNKTCYGEESDGIHDKSMGYLNYHEFQSETAQVVSGD